MSKGLSCGAILRGLLFTLALGAILSLLATTIFYFFPICTAALNIMGSVTLTLAVFAGGYLGAVTAGRRGFAHGLTLGFLVFILIVILTLLWGEISWPLLLQKAGLSLLGAALGGMLGVHGS